VFHARKSSLSDMISHDAAEEDQTPPILASDTTEQLFFAWTWLEPLAHSGQELL
jgi:hypothetical protein